MKTPENQQVGETRERVRINKVVVKPPVFFFSILLEVTNCKENEYYCIQPWEALKKFFQLHKTINETFLVNAKKADR